MKEIKAPDKFEFDGTTAIFLAGSIEQGKAVDWQKEIVKLLEEANVEITILNPRRDNWNAKLDQRKDNPDFREQVEWELEAQERANHILMFFDKETKSPITLLELGLFARTGRLIVCCPEGFWRKGNVDIVCEKYNVEQVETIEGLVLTLLHKLAQNKV